MKYLVIEYYDEDKIVDRLYIKVILRKNGNMTRLASRAIHAAMENKSLWGGKYTRVTIRKEE